MPTGVRFVPNETVCFGYCVKHQRIKAQNEWTPYELEKLRIVVAIYVFAKMKAPQFRETPCDQCEPLRDVLCGVYFPFIEEKVSCS